jgi:hypothetical protein
MIDLTTLINYSNDGIYDSKTMCLDVVLETIDDFNRMSKASSYFLKKYNHMIDKQTCLANLKKENPSNVYSGLYQLVADGFSLKTICKIYHNLLYCLSNNIKNADIGTLNKFNELGLQTEKIFNIKLIDVENFTTWLGNKKTENNISLQDDIKKMKEMIDHLRMELYNEQNKTIVLNNQCTSRIFEIENDNHIKTSALNNEISTLKSEIIKCKIELKLDDYINKQQSLKAEIHELEKYREKK